MAGQTFAVVSLCNLMDNAIDDRRETLHKATVRGVLDQHQRKIVAEPGEIPVPGKQGGMQAEPFDDLQAGARPITGQMKCDLRLKFRMHFGDCLQ